jgi:HJR/Mrr/RecB family endonuclease
MMLFGLRISFWAGIPFFIGGLIWSYPLIPYWVHAASPWPMLLIGHTLIGGGCLVTGTFLMFDGWIRSHHDQRMFEKYADVEALKSMPWDKFERLVAATFRRWKFQVQVQGGGHADGGIDLIVSKAGKKYLVQCKRYKGSVGVSVVREMFGVMVSEGFHGVYLMTSGTFTKEGRKFAEGKPMKLIPGTTLAKILADTAEK